MIEELNEHRESLPAQSNSAECQVLSTPQLQALEWLANGGSITDAAQFAGVTRSTLHRWLREEADFMAAYQDWRAQSLEIAKDRMVALTEAAMDNVAAAIREKRDLRASEFVLKQLRIAGR